MKAIASAFSVISQFDSNLGQQNCVLNVKVLCVAAGRQTNAVDASLESIPQHCISTSSWTAVMNCIPNFAS